MGKLEKKRGVCPNTIYRESFFLLVSSTKDLGTSSFHRVLSVEEVDPEFTSHTVYGPLSLYP